MSRKFTYRLLIAGVTAILILCILSLVIFLPSGKQTQAQSAKLSIAPNPASTGQTIMVNGFEYPAGATVEIYVQARANGVVRATANKGGFFNAPLTLPKQYINGPVSIYAVSNNLTTKAQLNLIKAAVTYHAPAPRSAVASFQGAGFVADASIDYVLTAGDNKITGTQRTDSQGHFTIALKLPDMPLDSKATLTATDQQRRKSIAVNVVYSPQIQLSSFAGTANTIVDVMGAGYAGNEWVSILFQGRRVALVFTNRHGGFFGSFRIPRTAKVSFYHDDVRAIGIRSRAAANNSFQVLPSVFSSTNTVVPGQRVTVMGRQFTPQKQVQIILFSPSQGASSVGTVLENTLVSTHGNFRATLSIPHNLAERKVYNIVYIDVASGLNVNTYINVI